MIKEQQKELKQLLRYLFMEKSILLSSMTRVRAVLYIINENKDISLRELASHTKQNIDKLFPLLYTCSVLGFIKITKSNVKITILGKKFLKTPYETTKKVLKKTQPFKEIFKLLKNNSMGTIELTHLLIKKDLLSGNPTELEELLKQSLNSWCINTNILSYDIKKDMWHLKSTLS